MPDGLPDAGRQPLMKGVDARVHDGARTDVSLLFSVQLKARRSQTCCSNKSCIDLCCVTYIIKGKNTRDRQSRGMDSKIAERCKLLLDGILNTDRPYKQELVKMKEETKTRSTELLTILSSAPSA